MRKRRFDYVRSRKLKRSGCSIRWGERGRSWGAFEQMEPRYLLAVSPVEVGVVYSEEDFGSDQQGDTFELAFVGGAAGTHLTQIVIDGDRHARGFGLADVFFDVATGGLGADSAFPLQVLSQEGVDSVSWTVGDGDTTLVLDFWGFDAGDRVVFTIDVDEVQEFVPLLVAQDEMNQGIDPITSGVEFQGSLFTARFTAPNYFDVESTTDFQNRYDAVLEATELDLPADNHGGKRGRTAAAVQTLYQNPVPVSISGYVYHDLDGDGYRETGEQGISNVRIQVIPINTIASQVPVTVTTESDGFYEATGQVPGTYRVVELDQPSPYLDGIDEVGSVNGARRGIAVNPGDLFEAITLSGGEAGIEYNFGEVLPVAIQGRVHLSKADGDCFDGTESYDPVAGAYVHLLAASGEVIQSVETDARGEYRFDEMRTGTYRVVEETPEGLISGGSRRGVVNGNPVGTVISGDIVSNIQLQSGQILPIDFCEYVPAELSGHVYHDHDGDGRRELGEEGISQVRMVLLDAAGIEVAEQLTDNGQYRFTGLRAGSYTVVEKHPAEWLDGIDTAGTRDGIVVGTAENPGDQIREIVLAWGDKGVDYDFAEFLPSTLSGLVHSEIGTRDCQFDQSIGEIALANVSIQLLDGNGGVRAETFTDSAGQYQFSGVRPGNYSIRQIQPEDYFAGAQVAASSGADVTGTNLITKVLVASGQALDHYNFCEESPVTLSGYVFQDGNTVRLAAGAKLPGRIRDIRDGQRSVDDTPLSGVVLELYDGMTAAELTSDRYLPGQYEKGIIQVETDAHGFYEFTGLRRGSYAVYETQPDGFVDGVDTQGSARGVVFNPGELIDTVALKLLEIDPQFNAIVRINLAPGFVSVENNFSEIKVEVAAINPPRKHRPIPFQPIVPLIFMDVPSDSLPTLNHYIRKPFGDGSGSAGYTWHLSVIDAGHPRGEGFVFEDAGLVWFVAATSGRRRMSETALYAGQWTVLQTNERATSAVAKQFNFGIPGAIPVTGDFDGDGFFEIGVFLNGEWFIDLNGNGVWDQEDLWAKLGHEGDLPVTGDWDGDGKHDIGIFGQAWPGDLKAVGREPGLPDRQNRPGGRQKNIPPDRQDATSGHRLMKLTSEGKTRADLIDHVFHYGLARDYPVSGDWNGDGITSIGIFCGGRWHIDMDGNGRWSKDDEEHDFGREGDVPVVGDFDGDGVDDLGIFRNGVFHVDTNGNRQLDAIDRVIRLGGANGQPVVGDWDGDGVDEVGVYRDGEPAPDAQARKAD